MSINRHKIANDMMRSKENDNNFRQRMHDIEKSIKLLENRHLKKFDSVSDRESEIESTIEKNKKLMEESDFEIKKLIQSNADKISHLKAHAAMVDRFEESTKKKIDEIISKMKEYRQEAIDRDEGLERKIGNKMDRHKKQTEEKFELLNKDIAKMKTYVIEMWEMIKITTTEKVDGEVTKLTEVFNEIKENLVERTDAILKKNKKSISNIKNTCAMFFDKYDKALQYMQKRFDNINATFEDYENNFMAPTKMREGRMYAIETKLKEQEDSREIEFNYLKLMIKKILDAFEQSIFVHGIESDIPTESNISTSFSNKIPVDTPENALNLVDIKTKESEAQEEIPNVENKTIIEITQEKFLPSLNRVQAKNLSFSQHPDSLALRDESEPKRKFSRLYSSHKKGNFNLNFT